MLNFIRKIRIDSAKKNFQRKKKFLNYKDIRRVLILFNIQQYAQIKEVIETLQADGKSVIAWTVRHQHEVHMLPAAIRVVDERKELSITQALNQQVKDEFDSLSYDTLIDFNSTNDYIFDYLLVCNKSRFCIGIRENQNIKLYDFIMRKPVKDSYLEIFKQMKYYLENIN